MPDCQANREPREAGVVQDTAQKPVSRLHPRGRAPSPGEGSAGRGAGLCRAGCAPLAGSPRAPPSGQRLSGLGPSWEGWGRGPGSRSEGLSYRDHPRGLHPGKHGEQGVGRGLRLRETAPCSTGCGRARRDPPRAPRKGSPLRSRGRLGWGGAFVWPGGARAGLSAEPRTLLGGARRCDSEQRPLSAHIEGPPGCYGLRGWKKGL